MAFRDQLALRAVGDYADFLLPHLDRQTSLLDLGCGDGALTVGLAEVCGRVVAVDLSADEFHDARAHAASQRLHNLAFLLADATRLPFGDGGFDVVLAHSVLESGLDPPSLLAEARRMLRPGGLIGVASVDYGGLILAGPHTKLLTHSNAIREQVWMRAGANPFLGRELRRLIYEAGFIDVDASTKAFSYGAPALVRDFAHNRAAECSDADYVAEVTHAGLATQDEMAEIATAWLAWGATEAAYAAFTWCRAVARRPSA